MQYLRYARRVRNRDILFRALCIFGIEMAMLAFIIKYYIDYGIDFDTDYGTVCLKYLCIIALHMMQ